MILPLFMKEKVKLHEMRNNKKNRYSKFWNFVMEYFIEIKPLISEEYDMTLEN